MILACICFLVVSLGAASWQRVGTETAYEVAPPLRTEGRFIIDSTGRRIKWACTNWYGAHMEQRVPNGLQVQSASQIAAVIRGLGFNCVRLPYSVQGVKQNAPVKAEFVAAMHGLESLKYMEVLDKVIAALTQAGLMVITNAHVSDSMWCCSENDGNGLWFNDNYSEQDWIDAIRGMAARNRHNPLVVGHDLRNEVRPDLRNMYFPEWSPPGLVGEAWNWVGQGVRTLLGWRIPRIFSWRQAVERGGAAVLSADPDALVVVEPYGAVFMCKSEMNAYPVRGMEGHVVWSFHDYRSFSVFTSLAQDLCGRESFSMLDLVWRFLEDLVGRKDPYPQNYKEYAEQRTASWGHIALENLGPVWLGEFGTDMSSAHTVSELDEFWHWVVAYLDETDIDFAYWTVNGESFPQGMEGATHRHEQAETWGILNADYHTVRSPGRLATLQALQRPSFGPLGAQELRRQINSTGFIPYIYTSDWHRPQERTGLWLASVTFALLPFLCLGSFLCCLIHPKCCGRFYPMQRPDPGLKRSLVAKSVYETEHASYGAA